jgi:hypothetical protein
MADNLEQPHQYEEPQPPSETTPYVPVDRPAPSKEAMEAVLLMLPPNDRSLYIIADAVDEKFEPLRRQIAQLREALNRMLVHFVGDEELCIECGENANEGCDTCYVIISAKQALSSTATEKTEAEK